MMPAATIEATFTAAVVVIFGLMIGSFLNVVIYRLPAEQSIVWPGSRCPKCNRSLTAWENIPVLSWLALRGRCHGCKAPISWRYPAIELATGLLFLLTYAQFGLGWQMAFVCALVALLMVTFWIDLDHMVIFDAVTLPGAVLGLIYSFFVTHAFLLSLAGALAGVAVLLLINSLTLLAIGEDGIGGGDLTLVAMMGAWLGLSQVFLALGLAMVAGALIGLVMLFGRWLGAGRWQPFVLAFAVGLPLYVATAGGLSLSLGMTGPEAWLGLGLTATMRGALVALAGLVGASAGWFYMRVTSDEGHLVMPFGPALVVGTMTSLFWGVPLVQWYQSMSL